MRTLRPAVCRTTPAPARPYAPPLVLPPALADLPDEPPPSMCLSCATCVLGGVTSHDYCELEIRWRGQRLPCRCPVCRPG